ncbi:MAG: AAA family ATPase [Pseudanabaenaceae cyanobacterium bins.39]|nr:AAA family ATPase [Pseudanabaenaceae cyanobacterium bins.39]
MTSSTLPPIIEQMLKPEFYDHPVTEPIQLLQTHISFVLLTGQYAYKVKKPMNFGFLDFSTLEKRQYFCTEELRLNRRLAPDLYLSVLPIVEKDGKYSFDRQGTGTAVEYAIAMPEFAQADLLIEMFQAGRLTIDHVKQIGEQLAAFHQKAETNDHINSFGTMAAMQSVANDNYASTEKYIGIAQTAEQLTATRAYTDQFFADHADFFSDRIAQGKIRECHGDVHLKNICLYQDRIQIFDCIEFNEPFRNSDVMYDAAFLLMDLQFRGRRDLANIFLNTYLERTGDYEGALLLPLHCSMRAYIRAKVTSFLLDDPNIPEQVKANAQTEASAYYRLAWEYTQPQQGKLILMSGLSGSGKSTTARAISTQQDAICLRSDAIRKHLAGIDLMERGSDDIYTPEMTAKTYSRLAELGSRLASQGFTVILDAKYDRVALRSQAIAAAQAVNVPVEIIYCDAPPEILAQRLRDRAAANNDIADATVDLLASQQASFEQFTDAERAIMKQI